MHCINLICEQIHPRLYYVLSFIEERYHQIKFKLITTNNLIEPNEYIIHYTNKKPAHNECWIYYSQAISNDVRHWPQPEYRLTADGFEIYFLEQHEQFDVFASIFYCIARIEEYQTFDKDEHDRFPAKSSLLFQTGHLQTAIVDLWITQFIKKIETHFNIQITCSTKFNWKIGFDIDQAFKYKHKPFYKFIGRLSLLLSDGNFKEMQNAIQQYFGLKKDIYDQYEYISSLNIPFHNIYFFILAGQHTPFDASHSLDQKAYQKNVEILRQIGTIGIHPSYSSMADINIMENDLSRLQKYFNQDNIQDSRQHFLRLQFPVTYQHLEKLSIKNDHSMGFADQAGFRAGTCHPFLWYDVHNERISELRIFPLHAMDRNFQKYLVSSKEQSIKIITSLIEECKKYNGYFNLCWHNSSFDFENEWKGFEGMLEKILDELKFYN